MTSNTASRGPGPGPRRAPRTRMHHTLSHGYRTLTRGRGQGGLESTGRRSMVGLPIEAIRRRDPETGCSWSELGDFEVGPPSRCLRRWTRAAYRLTAAPFELASCTRSAFRLRDRAAVSTRRLFSPKGFLSGLATPAVTPASRTRHALADAAMWSRVGDERPRCDRDPSSALWSFPPPAPSSLPRVSYVPPVRSQPTPP